VKSRGSQFNETLLVRAAVRPGKKLGLQSAAKNLQLRLSCMHAWRRYTDGCVCVSVCWFGWSIHVMALSDNDKMLVQDKLVAYIVVQKALVIVRQIV